MRVARSTCLLPLVASVLLLALAGCGALENMQRANEQAENPSASVGEAAGCGWQCLEWGQNCVVDARGIQKCARECKSFREVCE